MTQDSGLRSGNGGLLGTTLANGNRSAARVSRNARPRGLRRTDRRPGLAGPVPRADPGAEPSSVPVTVLKVAGSVIAPVSLLTALMFYFGLLHAYWFFGTFGVDYTVFGLTTQDYLIRSADGLFIPLTVVASAGLVVLWAYRLLPARLGEEWRAAAALVVPVLGALGVALLAIAVVGLRTPEKLLRYPALPGMALAVGVALLMAASRVHRWLRARREDDGAPDREPLALHAAEWTAVFLLVAVGLFWAAADWSAAVGTRRGAQVLESLRVWPDAVLYSDRQLHIATAGAREIHCRGGEAAGAYRYDGMHLIVQAGGQYLFLPTDWQGTGSAIVVPKTDDLHLVFTAHGASRAGTC